MSPFLKDRLSGRGYYGPNQCHECGYQKNHRLDCSRVNREEAYPDLLSEYQRALASRDRWLREMQFLEGKIAILMHENNKLRKELYQK